mmetsp:Transcript_22926/g.34770  ORF Transcript_22926/g.34770 Transcript_22926/m.34770 type:complete len:84 (-) Transcript_22926:3434-3685(-)
MAIRALQEESGAIAADLVKIQSTDFTTLTQRTGEVMNLGKHYQARYHNMLSRLAALESPGGMQQASAGSNNWGSQIFKPWRVA